jgi:hypothetical protein
MILLKTSFLILGLAWATAVSGLYFLQRELLYLPARHDPAPADLGLLGVTRHLLPTPDGETLVLWWAPADPGRPTVLFFHGNAGAMPDRADRLAFYQTRGLGAAFLSYRGYGGSSGRPSEAGFHTDADTAYRFLLAQGLPASRIVLVGESLGTGVAVQLAARHPVAAVVLEAPFTAAVDVAAQAYPGVPVRLLMRDPFRSRDHITRIGAPLLILHGEADQVIPFTMGQSLFAQASEPKSFTSLGPVGHEALFHPETWALGADFIDGLFPP